MNIKPDSLNQQIISAMCGDKKSMVKLIEYYSAENTCTSNTLLANYWLLRSNDIIATPDCILPYDEAYCLYEAGKYYYKNGKFKEAFSFFEESANKGYARASHFVGLYYKNGIGVEANVNIANTFFSTAAKAGCEDSMIELADSYYDKKEFKDAFLWYQQAAKQGRNKGYYMIGMFYANGLYVENDNEKAVEYYQKATKSYRDPDAKTLAYKALIKCYREGIGVEKDINLSILYRKRLGEKDLEYI